MILEAAVTYSDVIVLDFLRKHAPGGVEVPLSNAEIIKATSIPERTVRRTLSRLHRAGLIERKRPVGEVYTYKVIDGSTAFA